MSDRVKTYLRKVQRLTRAAQSFREPLLKGVPRVRRICRRLKMVEKAGKGVPQRFIEVDEVDESIF